MKPLQYIIIAFTLYSCMGTNRQAKLPAFDLLLSDSITRINTKQLGGNQALALLYFSPDCEHCQEETRSILKNIDAFKNVKICFISNDAIEDIRAFNAHYRLNQYPNIIIGRDEQFAFPRQFKGVTPPYMIIYDKDENQKAVFNGTTDIDKIINAFNRI